MKNEFGRVAVAAIAAPTLLFALAGCSGSVDEPATEGELAGGQTQEEGTTGGFAPPETTASDDTATDAAGDATEYAEAIAAAEESVGDGAFAVALDREDDDRERFDIDVVQGTTVHELNVATDGTVSTDEVEEREVDGEDQRELDAAELTILEAIEAALAEQAGVIEEVELETENDTVVWKVDFADDGLPDLYINAADGTVTEDTDD